MRNVAIRTWMAATVLALGCAPDDPGGAEDAPAPARGAEVSQGDENAKTTGWDDVRFDPSEQPDVVGPVEEESSELPSQESSDFDTQEAVSAGCEATTGSPRNLSLRGNLGTHDPVIIAAGGRYYEYQTGKGVYGKVSSDLINWNPLPSQIPSLPAWVKRQVPGVSDLWAPDVAEFGGKFHMYYSASTFGSNRSCIGHATSTNLASNQWKDENGVICSNTGSSKKDNWNAIDPNVAIDDKGTPWLAFGSFWGGIKMIRLTADGKRADQQVYSLAARPNNGGAVEAPFVIRRCGYYYLFVSFDKCCAGANSTYKIAVGRSKSITGPYVDKSGRSMMDGGGTVVVQGNSKWKGPGHNAILHDKGKFYNVYHAYAASDGHAELRISEMTFDSAGWPVLAGP